MILLDFVFADTKQVSTTIAMTERKWEQWCLEAQGAGLTLEAYLLPVIEQAIPRLGTNEVRRIIRQQPSASRAISVLVTASSKVDEATPSSFGTE
jgi:hypothetical protein